MKLRAFLFLLLLAGCGRPLSETELAFATLIQGDQLNMSRVRLVEGAPLSSVTYRRKARPRVSCRERILPPAKDEVVTVTPAAMTLFNKVLFSKNWYVDNYLPAFPERLYLIESMLFVHEMTHVWQWQNRDRTGYSPLLAAFEQINNDDPYLFDLAQAPEFLDYGYEQQGAIVEEYLCCRALAPGAARTKRLHSMLSGAFPVADLPSDGKREWNVYLPWKEAELGGVCA
jgi:hypothetical protein